MTLREREGVGPDRRDWVLYKRLGRKMFMFYRRLERAGYGIKVCLEAGGTTTLRPWDWKFGGGRNQGAMGRWAYNNKNKRCVVVRLPEKPPRGRSWKPTKAWLK